MQFTGIIHSDLKPANFLLVGGKLKLIDFGIAKALQQDKTGVILETQIGTLNYMSPEAIKDLESCGDQKPKFKVMTICTLLRLIVKCWRADKDVSIHNSTFAVNILSHLPDSIMCYYKSKLIPNKQKIL